MATKKDLVEAHAFSRRRLITAFVSGAPGGREVEPNRPGRTVVAGVALAVLLVAGAAVLGVLTSPVVVDWDEQDLVSDKDSGADYAVVTDPDTGDRQLRPIVNITSARLLFGADVESLEVPRDEIATQSLGPPIGILEAPSVPPDDLIQNGWTACTGTDDGDPLGVRLHLAETPQVEPSPDVGFVVRSEGVHYLVAEADAPDDRTTPRAFAYPVPGGDAGSILLNAAGTDIDDAVDVPAAWLQLFPEGGPLTLASFGLTPAEVGQPSTAEVEGLPPDVATGDVLVFGDDRYVLTTDAAIRLTAFSAEVYLNLDFPGPGQPDFAVEVGRSPAGATTVPPPMVTWPPGALARSTAPDVCAVLDTGPGLQPDVRLATSPGPDATAESLAADETVPTVEDGHGAFVLSGDFDAAGPATLTLVDSRAIRYPLAGEAERANLGYGGEDDVVVPDSWLSLLVDGVPLSIDGALCPPTSRAQAEPCAGAP